MYYTHTSAAPNLPTSPPRVQGSHKHMTTFVVLADFAVPALFKQRCGSFHCASTDRWREFIVIAAPTAMRKEDHFADTKYFLSSAATSNTPHHTTNTSNTSIFPATFYPQQHPSSVPPAATTKQDELFSRRYMRYSEQREGPI